jgi:hypothetical protein
MDLDIENGIEIIKIAYIKQSEERLWQRWLVERPYMDPFIPFEKYKKKAIKNKIENNCNIDTKKIIEEAEKIKNLDQKGGKS